MPRKTEVQKNVIAQRRTQVAALMLRCVTMDGMAAQLGVSRTTIATDKVAIRQEWRDSEVWDFQASRLLEVNRVDHIAAEALASWEKSKGGSMRNPHGDARFLELALKAVERRSRLLGLDAPTRIETDNTNRTMTVDIRRLLDDPASREQLLSLTGRLIDLPCLARGSGNGDQPGALEDGEASRSAEPDACAGELGDHHAADREHAAAPREIGDVLEVSADVVSRAESGQAGNSDGIRS